MSPHPGAHSLSIRPRSSPVNQRGNHVHSTVPIRRGDSRRSDPDTTGYRRFQFIKGNGILVHGDADLIKRGLRLFACQPPGSHINQEQMVVGAARHQAPTAFF